MMEETHETKRLKKSSVAKLVKKQRLYNYILKKQTQKTQMGCDYYVVGVLKIKCNKDSVVTVTKLQVSQTPRYYFRNDPDDDQSEDRAQQKVNACCKYLDPITGLRSNRRVYFRETDGWLITSVDAIADFLEIMRLQGITNFTKIVKTFYANSR
jgi:hypothetical protein